LDSAAEEIADLYMVAEDIAAGDKFVADTRTAGIAVDTVERALESQEAAQCR
jgi:hypothetical protein